MLSLLGRGSQGGLGPSEVRRGLGGFGVPPVCLCVPLARPACPLLSCCVPSWEVRTDGGKKLVEV